MWFNAVYTINTAKKMKIFLKCMAISTKTSEIEAISGAFFLL
jgi:hypothetical protein